MEDKELFTKNIEFLKKSPIYAMSLGSKELFHSNFWAFLMEQKDYREFMKLFFPEIDLTSELKIEREYKNRDIVILFSNKEYVIENKIKSYPNLEQLKKYGDDDNMAKGIITGIKEPPFDLPSKWKYISYSDISNGLRTFTTTDKELETIVLKYCDVLDSINELMTLSMKETDGRLSYSTKNIDLLNEIRLLDVYRKLKADNFAIYCEDLKKEFDEKLRNASEWRFKISRSFHNGKATLSFEFLKYIKKGEGSIYQGQIGVQIEDNQFRLFLGADKSFKKTTDDIYNYGVQKGWFDPLFNKRENKKVFERETSMSHDYCSYSGTWVYQYFNTWISERNNIQEYPELKKITKDYLDKAFKSIPQLDEEFLAK